MSLYKDYYQVLEEVRMDKGVSVEDLCEGIISSRTYSRYLKSTDQINMTTLAKLFDRLETNVAAAAVYGIHLRSEDPGTIKFIYRACTFLYDDIDIWYEKIKTIKNDQTFEYYGLKSVCSRYEYQRDYIDKKQYYNHIRSYIDDFPKINDANNSISVFINLCLLEADDNTTRNNIIDFVNKAVHNDFRSDFLWFVVANNFMFQTMIKYAYEDIESFESKFLNYFQGLKHFSFKYVYSQAYFFRSYLAHLKQEYALRDKWLFKFLISTMQISSEKQIDEIKREIKDIYEIDVKSFVLSYLQTAVDNSPIKIL